MLKEIINFFKTGENKPVFTTDKGKIKKVYEHMRWRIFITLTVGYGLFYICRTNLSIIKKPMMDAGILDPGQLGLIGSALLITYAVGKLVNGVLGDRSNVRKYVSIGFLLSAFINLYLGFTPLFITFIILWALNGWFQATGASPSISSLANWFSPKELGSRYGIWSLGHFIGEGVTYIGTAFVVASLGWQWGFWGPGIAGVLIAIIMYMSLADRPQTYGLPPVTEYKNDCPEEICETDKSVGKVQFEIIKNPLIWILGLASLSMYISRYAISSWAMLFLQEAKHYSIIQAGAILAAYPIAGIFGSASSGIVSDLFFKGKRHWPVVIYGSLQVLGLSLIYTIPEQYIWLNTCAMALCGFALGGLLVFLGGLMAVDICSKKAAGTAAGMMGLMGYFGAAAQDTISGYLINASKTMVAGKAVYHFDSAFYFWIGASIMAIIFASITWKAKPKA